METRIITGKDLSKEWIELVTDSYYERRLSDQDIEDEVNTTYNEAWMDGVMMNCTVSARIQEAKCIVKKFNK